ncbi:MAG: ATP-dependent RecD-like DNA helicase [Acholeplasmataceae bacterium]|nr:ATP-dependent RecD-like DNA helicase [Acholeplasmataceae bacterium]
MDRLNGKIKNYVYHNEENSYSIARVITDTDEQITIVGYFPKLSEDVMYEFVGEWTTHSTYGEQFKLTSFHKSEKQSRLGLISYLSSDFFTGIGPKTAAKIVDYLGEKAIQEILDNPEVLGEVGLNRIRIAKFHQQLQENQMYERILVHLYGYEITANVAMKLLNKYQFKTIEVLEENPYQLIDDIEGIGFIKADQIAQKLGLEKNDVKRIQAAIIYTLDHLTYQNGDIYLTAEQLQDRVHYVLGEPMVLDEAIEILIDKKKIIFDDDKYYLALSYHTEIKLAEKILTIQEHPFKQPDIEAIETFIDLIQVQQNIAYTDIQKEAIKVALTNKITVITGGPGTGKTTIIEGLLQVYFRYHRLKAENPSLVEKIACLAPTGRAAKRMEEILDFPASTIHRHLGYNYEGMFMYDESHLLSQELIIIDESSMIDLFLALRLFSAIKPDAQIVIVGDVDQLPSVGPGQVLQDIIESNKLPVIRLDEIHRQAKDSSIVHLAQLVNQQTISKADLKTENDVYLYSAQADKIKQTMIQQISGALKQGYDMVEDIQVLVPLYKGDLGIDAFNELLQKAFNPNQTRKMVYQETTFYENDKVIQLVNDPKRGIMNGDIGLVEAIITDENDKPKMIVTFDGNRVIYEQQDLSELSLAYAVSIHKAQGSEYKIVIIPMVRSHIHMLKKELLYTAITRAKQFLIILGDMNLLVYASTHLQTKRQTTLAYRLNHQLEVDLEDEISPYDFL